MSNKSINNNTIAKEEYHGLNTIFYRDYNVDYFMEKTVHSTYLLNDTQNYKDKLRQMELEVEKIKFPNVTTTKEDIEKYAKNEVINAYYRCLETFIRLFIGHATDTHCPWLEIYNLKLLQSSFYRYCYITSLIVNPDTI